MATLYCSTVIVVGVAVFYLCLSILDSSQLHTRRRYACDGDRLMQGYLEHIRLEGTDPVCVRQLSALWLAVV
jgi:hypothetical protein